MFAIDALLLNCSNNGPRRAYRNSRRVDLGSPITFEPELAVGWRITPKMALEASWIHLSHATLFSRQNRGMDSMGVRMIYHFSRWQILGRERSHGGWSMQVARSETSSLPARPPPPVMPSRFRPGKRVFL